MTAKSLSDLVTDWGGFERLVAQLHETGQVVVEHNVKLKGRSGALRQIDVLVRHREGLYEHLIVVECKYRNAPIERLHVDALATTIREVGAARGVIFSTEGFQRGAIEQAAHDNISLFQLREPSDEEWGRPGRHLDIWMHIISIGVGHPQLPGAFAFAPGPSAKAELALNLGYPEHGSFTPVRLDNGEETSLEHLIERVARHSARSAYLPRRIDFNGSDEGEVRAVTQIHFKPKRALQIRANETDLFLPEIQFLVGLCVHQSRFQIDRGERYAFVLAIEDCVNNLVSTASRERDGGTTTVQLVERQPVEDNDVFQNGSLMQVWLGPFEQFEKFDGVERNQTSHADIKISMEALLGRELGREGRT